jgi:small subunit ribosomal protein S2
MTEPTSEAPASAPDAPVSETAEALHKQELSIPELIEAGVHFGHQTRRWNPRMKSFLFGERNGVHIVDLDQTLPRFKDALEFLCEVTASGGKVLFVATKRQAQESVKLESERSRQYYVNNRWLGGMLTNFKTVKKSIDRYKVMLETVADEEQVAGLSKKELSRINRLIGKYRKSLEGIREMTRLPDCLFVLDVGREQIAVSEAQRLGIPVVAVVDSNCSPDDIDFVIPGNDDSTRAIQLYCSRVADACLQGDAEHQERIKAEVEAAEQRQAEAAEKATTASGRKVVEIQAEGALGRGAASFGGRRDEDESPAPAAAPAAPAAAPEAAAPEAAAAETAPTEPVPAEAAPAGETPSEPVKTESAPAAEPKE